MGFAGASRDKKCAGSLRWFAKATINHGITEHVGVDTMYLKGGGGKTIFVTKRTVFQA